MVTSQGSPERFLVFGTGAAERYHQRWFDDRTAAGWTRGDVRDDAAKHNPLLVRWADLPDDAKAFNLATARELLPMLARNSFEAGRR